jgi:acid phosphatase
LLALAALSIVAGVLIPPALGRSPSASAWFSLPNFSHIVTIVMENQEYGDIVGNPQASYINSLVGQYGLATQYYAITHPSLPNYLTLTGGSTFGVTTDCDPGPGCPSSATNITDEIETSGRTWRAYMESMPAPCTMTDSGEYAVRHDPFVYYTDISGNSTRCNADVKPYSQFATDLAGSLPNYAWITPDLCDDMHDSCAPLNDPVLQGDTWLSQNVPQILASAAFQNNGALFIVWDEGISNNGCCNGQAAGGQVMALVVSPLAKTGYQSGTAEDHYNLLRTVEDAWGLNSLGSTAQASAMKEYFKTGTPAPATSASFAPQPNTAGWNNTPVTVTLTATDNQPGGFGVAATYYAVQNAACSPSSPPASLTACTTYASPFLLSTDGSHPVYFFSKGNAGTYEKRKTQRVNLDQTPPTCTAIANPSSVWPPNHQLVSVTVTVTVTDTPSGPGGLTLHSKTASKAASDSAGFDHVGSPSMSGGGHMATYSIDGQVTANKDEVYTLVYGAVDKAGNATTCPTLTISVPHDQGRGQ